MSKFRLLSSQHEDAQGRRYEKGDIVESPDDLVSKFGILKFRKVRGRSEPIASADSGDEDIEELDDDDVEDFDDEDDAEDEAPAGQDVTADFKNVGEGITVLAYKGGYFEVLRDGDVLHKGKLRKVGAVALIKSLK